MILDITVLDDQLVSRDKILEQGCYYVKCNKKKCNRGIGCRDDNNGGDKIKRSQDVDRQIKTRVMIMERIRKDYSIRLITQKEC